MRASVTVMMMCLVVGCGSSDTGTGGGTGGSAGASGASGTGGGSSGTTPCGAMSCPAGQYCVAGTTCTPGCTSDQNCAGGQTCANMDMVTHVGNCAGGTAPKDCAGYLTKCNACGGGSLCTQQSCDALSAECVSCIASSNCNDSGNCPCN